MAGYCKRCREGIPHAWDHGSANGYNYHRCRCPKCRGFKAGDARARYRADAAHAAERMRRYRHENPEKVSAWPSVRNGGRSTTLWKKRNEAAVSASDTRRRERVSRIPVTHSWFWTTDEDEFLLSHPGTLLEAAHHLGRSYSAVMHRHARLRRGVQHIGHNGRRSLSEHGSVPRYKGGCRCELCRRANAEAEANRRRRVPHEEGKCQL